MPKTFEQTYAESGRQAELDQLGRTGQLEAAKAKWLATQGGTPATPIATPNFSNAGMVATSPSGGGGGGNLQQQLAESGHLDTWNQYNAGQISEAQARSVLGTSGSMGASGVSGLMTTQPTLNLPSLYENLYKSSGISDTERQYSDMEKSFIEAKGKINDNPFLSEATRVGRIAKLESLFAERTANIKNDIATKKADIETQLNLQTKQFDINSQAATQALNQFNSLLSSGALDNASGEDIANITRATGISSSMIQSAIQASVKSKQKEAKTQVITSTADSGEVTVSVVNADTGEVIKQSSLGNVGNAQKGTAASAKEQTYIDDQQNRQNATNDIQRGVTLRNLINHYAVMGGLTVEELYRLYNSYSPYGQAEEDIDAVKSGQFVA